jgi:hypothetical protein
MDRVRRHGGMSRGCDDIRDFLVKELPQSRNINPIEVQDLRRIRFDEALGIHLGQISLWLNRGTTSTHIIPKTHYLMGREPANQVLLRRGMRRECDSISTRHVPSQKFFEIGYIDPFMV